MQEVNKRHGQPRDKNLAALLILGSPGIAVMLCWTLAPNASAVLANPAARNSVLCLRTRDLAIPS
jgi:hypothetical protein